MNVRDFPYINGVNDHSFAAFTIINRLPAILDQIIEDNFFDTAINSRLVELKHHILHEKVTHFIRSGHDQAQWKNWLTPWIGKRWFEIPFYFAEAYFYRLILDEVEFFDKHIDPFLLQKKRDIRNNHKRFISILMDFECFLKGNPGKDLHITYQLFLSLWGNKSDLSQLQISRDEKQKFAEDYTILDDSAETVKRFSNSIKQVDIILDNSGVELFADLILAVELISSKLSDTVILHTKAYPTFVSDATSDDVFGLIDYFKNHENELVFDFAQKLELLIERQQIQVRDHEFWNAPLHFCEMPKDLRKELSKADLLISKGDANYRRIFEDRNIPADTSLDSFGKFMPAPTLAIRILKSELMIGMQKENVQALDKNDPEWRINGQYGLIQRIKN